MVHVFDVVHCTHKCSFFRNLITRNAEFIWKHSHAFLLALVLAAGDKRSLCLVLKTLMFTSLMEMDYLVLF